MASICAASPILASSFMINGLPMRLSSVATSEYIRAAIRHDWLLI